MSNYTKPNIILDLDETVIYSLSKKDLSKLGDQEKVLETINKNYETHSMDNGYYTVCERPDLQPFLTYLFENFNVSIWTAASKDYALFIIDNIIIDKEKTRKIDWTFFSYHCDLSESKTKSIKNLKMLWDHYKLDGYTKENTIILDDHPVVFKTQEANCIYMDPFQINKGNMNNPSDDFLRRLQERLKIIKSDFDKGIPMDTTNANEILAGR